MKTIVPFRAPRAPQPEPKAVLTYGDIQVELDLTYLHHLVNQGGWRSRHWGHFTAADHTMAETMEEIEKAMWREAVPGVYRPVLRDGPRSQ